MLWKNRRESDNVEDMRGQGYSGRGRGGVRLSGGMLALVVVVSLLFGENPMQVLALLSGSGMGSSQQSTPNTANPGQKDDAARFVSVVLANTEEVWQQVLARQSMRYQAPKLVLFSDRIDSACGFASAASGPFYCPGDRKVYLDLHFFNELQQLGAPGDFAQAYVIGHEVAHHVQNLLGISGKVHQLQQSNRSQANALSVMLELQADCLAGVWAHYANQQHKMLEPGDIEEGLNAASAIGDDRLMQSAGRTVSPDAFTHGSAQQRASWLRQGMQTGDINACNTFSG